MADRYELVREVCGKGLMIGIEFGHPRSFKLKTSWNLLETASKGLFCQLITIPWLEGASDLTLPDSQLHPKTRQARSEIQRSRCVGAAEEAVHPDRVEHHQDQDQRHQCGTERATTVPTQPGDRAELAQLERNAEPGT
jgi:hypothetical protein